jgi:hypothetical protein
MDSGVFLTTNGGTSWTEVDSGLTSKVAWSLAVSGSNIFATTHTGGVWRRPLSEMVGAINHQPHRNPPTQPTCDIHSPTRANPIATLSLSLPHSDHVTARAYDLSGHVVATLINRNLGPGSHSLSWDTRNLATGCYTLRVQAGSTTTVTSLPILR